MHSSHDILRESNLLSGISKTTGTAIYPSDIFPSDMLVGLVVRSPYPHCKIKKIETREAKAVPGVHAVITAQDIPGLNKLGKTVFDQPILAKEKARTVMDALVLIAAETPNIAAQAAEAVELELEPLPAVFSVAEALKEGAPKVHEKGNLLRSYHLERGDVAKGFQQADVILEKIYQSPAIEHSYLEPDAGVAIPVDEGGYKLWIGCHSVFSEQQIASLTINIPEDKIEVIQTHTGGSFGGKDDGLLTAFLSLLVYHTRKPVRMVMNRRELFRSHTKRAAQKIYVRMGAKSDGEITAAAYQIETDTGAYAHWAEGIFLFASIGAPGPYRTANLTVDTKIVYTNNIAMGAMRAWGMPGVQFATECHLDLIAREIGIQSLKLRMINAVDEGDEIITGQVLPTGVGLRATLRAAAQDMRIDLKD
jgi:CO/xanthine dehydrogenase Mo-binding subunit